MGQDRTLGLFQRYPSKPHFELRKTVVISARMETAISAGPAAPIGSPAGHGCGGTCLRTGDPGCFRENPLTTIFRLEQGFDCSDMLDPKILSIGECRHQFGGQPRKVEVTTKPAFSDIYPLGHDLLPPILIGIQHEEIITSAFQTRQKIGRAS